MTSRSPRRDAQGTVPGASLASLTNRALRPLLAAVCALATFGCSTFQAEWEGGPEPIPYGGTRLNLELVQNPDRHSEPTLLYGLADLPFSLVADTVLLPFQVFRGYVGERAISAPGPAHPYGGRPFADHRHAVTAKPVPATPAEPSGLATTESR